MKALLNKKQQDVLKLQSEIKTFDRAIDRETERIGEIQKDVQTCHESVGKDDTIMEKCLRVSRQNFVFFEQCITIGFKVFMKRKFLLHYVKEFVKL